MTHLFIINPAAGSHDQTQLYRDAITDLCNKKGLNYRIEVSTAPGECRRIAAEAAASGEETRIYACGGDGTLNEIASGVVGYDNVAVTMFAGGSGNDFIRIFNDTEPFRHLERLMDCEESRFDLIKCNGDYAVNVCSVGLDARIGTDIARYKRLPLLHGFRAYAASAIVNVVRGINEHYIVEFNGEKLDRKMALVCCCNGRFYGGGFNPAPHADPTDGLLDVILVRDVSRLKVISTIGRYKNGRCDEFPKLIRHVQTNHITIRCDKSTGINLDGELRHSQTMDIQIVPKALRFFYPRGLHF